MLFSCQTGQVLPGSLLSLGLISGLGVTASPALTAFVEDAERVSLRIAQSALSTSINVNHLLARASASKKLIIEGKEVKLKYGFPEASIIELEKVADFGTQILENTDSKTVTIWSRYKSWCFNYTEAELIGNLIEPAHIGEITPATNDNCTNS